MRDPVRMWGNPNTKKQSVFSSFYLKYTFFHGLHIMRLAVKVPLGTFPCLCLALLFNTGDNIAQSIGFNDNVFCRNFGQLTFNIIVHITPFSFLQKQS